MGNYQDYVLPGCEDLVLHHLYRAMAWLGEELAESAQAHRTQAPRCVKDLIEEALLARRQDLFSDLSVVFMVRVRRGPPCEEGWPVADCRYGYLY